MGLLLGQVSKWRAQRADRGAHAARGFVGGAANFSVAHETVAMCVSMPHAALWVVQRPFSCKVVRITVSFNAARGFVGGAAAPPTSPRKRLGRFNAARGFVGGAASGKKMICW